MKKLCLALMFMFFVTGCTLVGSIASPTKSVENFLGKYQSLNADVLTQLDTVIADEKLTSDEADDYRNLMKNQYKNLTYKTNNEVIKGNKATVTTQIEVYDLGKTQETVDTFVEANRKNFQNEEGAFSNTKYVDYKIGELKKVNSRVKYNVDFTLTKVNDNWEIDNISETTRQKISGFYSNV